MMAVPVAAGRADRKASCETTALFIRSRHRIKQSAGLGRFQLCATGIMMTSLPYVSSSSRILDLSLAIFP